MLKHYLIVALRNLIKHKINSLIKVLGLALGLAAALLVMIVNYSELTWDRFWPDAEQIYMVSTKASGRTPPTMDSMGEANFQQVREQLAKQFWMTQLAPTQTSVRVQENNSDSAVSHRISINRVDPDFLTIFPARVIQGDISAFAQNPNSAVISQVIAEQLFGKKNPLGKTVELTLEPTLEQRESGALPQLYPVTIIAVVDIDNPRSHIMPALFFPQIDYPQMDPDKPGYMRETYIKSRQAMAPSAIEAALNAAAEAMLPADEHLRKLRRTEYVLMPITERHMHDTNSDGNQKRVVILSVLGVLILIVAISNFINLSLAGYVSRQKEVALRRIQGARVRQLFWQYWLETLIYIVLACLGALIICELLVPQLRAELQMPLVDGIFVSPLLALLCALIVLAVAFIIALYPAVYFSRINAATILRANRSTENPVSIMTRKLLLVVQFFAVGALIVGLASIRLQLNVIDAYEPGYKTKDIVMTINQGTPPSAEKLLVIKQQIAQLPGVIASAAVLGDIPGRQELIMEINSRVNEQEQVLNVMFDWIADADYFSTLGIQQIAGTRELLEASFKPVAGTGQINPDMGVILCRTTAARLGFATPEAALGQSIGLFRQPGAPNVATGKVVAVVENAHIGSHKKPPMDCMFIALSRVAGSGMPFAVNFAHAPTEQDINAVKKIWEESTGALPHHWLFSGSLADRYKNERRVQLFVSGFALAALAIGLLGIYGITALSTQKRAREIALRKLHGANQWQIIALLNRDFALLVMLANLLAWPCAIYLINIWLEDFHRHFLLSLWLPVFCVAALGLSLLMVWLTATAHSFATGRMRPAEVLRDE